MNPSIFYCVLFTLALYCQIINSLKHHLVLTNDDRYQVGISSFGYNIYGRLEVIVQNLSLAPDPSDDSKVPRYGFVLLRSDQAKNPYAARPVQQDFHSPCLISDPKHQFRFDLMSLIIIPADNRVLIRCTGDKTIFPPIKPLPRDYSGYIHTYNKRAAAHLDKPLISDIIVPEQSNKISPLYHECRNSPDHLPLQTSSDEMGRKLYSFNFSMLIGDKSEEGNYFLSFQNCLGLQKYDKYSGSRNGQTTTRFNLSMLIFETNSPENYLSAGAMPLPQMYFMLSVMFFLSGCIWVNYLRSQKENILKIHNLMTVLVFAKACSLLFHGINYHYISLDGQPVVTWAYLYYATRLVKGALFFITLALIGSGWTFIKHILSPRDKKIIIVIVALQLVAHVAEIILDESTEGEASIEFWKKLCALVDLFSCFSILVLISWSLRHLEEASGTDGKAAVNLKKMELFKSFYVVSTVYIYATRIVQFVILSMLVFKYSWLAELFSELATLVYFVVTGYYFQPMTTNPYSLLSTANDQEEDILFSVDAHEMNASRRGDQDEQTDRDALLFGEGEKTKVTRRVLEEFV